MGDDEARSMGVKTESLKLFIIVCTTLITASAVSVSGIVGWVGLVIPHVGRMIVGPNHRWLLPTSMALGAVFLLVVDDIARTATSASGCYLYSTRHLEPDHAAVLAEWLDVGQFDNP